MTSWIRLQKKKVNKAKLNNRIISNYEISAQQKSQRMADRCKKERKYLQIMLLTKEKYAKCV